MLRSTVLLLLAVLWFLPQNLSAHGITDKTVTKEQATQLAQQRYPGRIVKVQTESRYYRVRLLQSDGRVITVLVDIRTGQVQRDDN
ncbi:PepSY domain-containing protein [Chromatiaceae bacterium AAb-1]|nr:PepSY domain-containing protein [Chromatiaceae bacterium AAb-1]